MLHSFSSTGSKIYNRLRESGASLQERGEGEVPLETVSSNTPPNANSGNIVKGMNDIRDYKIVTLDNGMQVVLASDPSLRYVYYIYKYTYIFIYVYIYI